MTINAGKTLHKRKGNIKLKKNKKKTLTKNSKDVESGIGDTRNLGKKFLMLSAVSRCFKSKKNSKSFPMLLSIDSITEGALGV